MAKRWFFLRNYDLVIEGVFPNINSINMKLCVLKSDISDMPDVRNNVFNEVL